MIEELRDYLIRRGVVEDVADEIHDFYYHWEMEGARACGVDYEFDADEIEGMVNSWKQEVGEA